MEVNFNINRKQQNLLDKTVDMMNNVSKRNASWLLERLERTGGKFYRFTWTYEPEWNGEPHTAEGRTFTELLNVIWLWVDDHRHSGVI